MTTKKRGPSLYEVLKDTLRKREQERQRLAAMTPAEAPAFAEAPAATPPPAVEPEAAETPEPEPVASAPVEIPAEPEPAPEPIPEPVALPPEPDPIPTFTPTPVSSPHRWRGIGERTIVMTYNTTAFAGLVLLLTVVAAYSAGLSRGRTEVEISTPETTPTETTIVPPTPPSPAPAPAPQWRIRVYAWEVPSADQAHHRVASPLRRQLEQAGFTGLRVETAPTANGRFAAVLTAGAFADRSSAEAQNFFRRLGQQNFRGASLGRQLAFVPF